jgi:hypothetical protein
MEMRDQEHQEMLVAEAGEVAALEVAEEPVLGVAGHHEGMARGPVARARPVAAVDRVLPQVVAVLLSELVEIGLVEGQLGAVAGAARERETDVVRARQPVRLLDGEIRHQRHAVIFELAIAHRTLLVGVVKHQRLQQKLPMRGDAGRAVLAGEGEKLLAVLVVRDRENLVLARQPFDAARAVACPAVLLPVGRIGAPQLEHRLLRDLERQVVGMDLERERRDVDVEEEIEVDVGDVEDDRRAAGGERHAHLGDVVPADDPDRTFAIAAPHRAAETLAVEEALHRRQEGDELGVMSLLEFRRIAGEFVLHLAPRMGRRGGRDVRPVVLDLLAVVGRQEIDRPQQDLAEMPDPQSAGSGPASRRPRHRRRIVHAVPSRRRISGAVRLPCTVLAPDLRIFCDSARCPWNRNHARRRRQRHGGRAACGRRAVPV